MIKKTFLWFDKDTIKHLRFPFSFFLLPVFMFALSQAKMINWEQAILSFFILHGLVFPSSNGYNSYQDKDETSIGGLKHPPKVTLNLFYATLFFDLTAILLGLFISIWFSAFIVVFILMSRAYSYRRIRLKKYPIPAFFTVFVFQGGFIFLTSLIAITDLPPNKLLTTGNSLCMSVASLFMGSMYPLTQIYQHESDKKDGVISMSYKLGYNGTFLFSGLLFILASSLMAIYFRLNKNGFAIWLFLLSIIPMIVLIMSWSKKVKKDIKHANFENAMSMNLVSSLCMNLYFLMLVLNNNFYWF